MCVCPFVNNLGNAHPCSFTRTIDKMSHFKEGVVLIRREISLKVICKKRLNFQTVFVFAIIKFRDYEWTYILIVQKP